MNILETLASGLLNYSRSEPEGLLARGMRQPAGLLGRGLNNAANMQGPGLLAQQQAFFQPSVMNTPEQTRADGAAFLQSIASGPLGMAPLGMTKRGITPQDLASKSIPSRPMLTMDDIQGMYPGGGKKVRSAGGVDYYATPDGVYAIKNGKEVGFAAPMAADAAQGFDVSVATEMQRQGVGGNLFELFRQRFPDYPTGGLTAAGRGMLEKNSK
jgi:hypothetical protein